MTELHVERDGNGDVVLRDRKTGTWFDLKCVVIDFSNCYDGIDEKFKAGNFEIILDDNHGKIEKYGDSFRYSERVEELEAYNTAVSEALAWHETFGEMPTKGELFELIYKKVKPEYIFESIRYVFDGLE